ncbi:MAG TPA: hypothetical protein PKD64_08435 [Pirellulaceae bacterium]|nr:hypothetical protein [Pirellulaceae bacterium]HMO92214.1 hypothetical protein [Pirellulaceae bacterium]HMP68859.1 hypothetical protein [Pirellulaceae bacterium]
MANASVSITNSISCITRTVGVSYGIAGAGWKGEWPTRQEQSFSQWQVACAIVPDKRLHSRCPEIDESLIDAELGLGFEQHEFAEAKSGSGVRQQQQTSLTSGFCAPGEHPQLLCETSKSGLANITAATNHVVTWRSK